MLTNAHQGVDEIEAMAYAFYLGYTFGLGIEEMCGAGYKPTPSREKLEKVKDYCIKRAVFEPDNRAGFAKMIEMVNNELTKLDTAGMSVKSALDYMGTHTSIRGLTDDAIFGKE